MKQPVLTLLALSLLLLAGAFFLPDQPLPAAASSHTDLDRLRDLYVKTGGHTHWKRHCKDEWHYQFDDETRIVTLGAGRVIALRLADCGLVGPIPKSMMGLTRLQVLDLADNNLSGPLPKEIGNLSDLVQLDLGNNRLDGAIPPHIGNIPNLEILNLENNRLSGELPPQLNNLVNLTELRLNRNYLHGEIPHSFDNLAFIEILRLQETSASRRTNRLWGCLRMPPGDTQTGVPYCQDGRLPPPTPTPRPTPTRVRFPTPTYTPVPTFTPVPTYTPRPTFTPAPTWTPVPTPTPVVNPEGNLTALRREVPAGEPIKLTLTLTGHPRSWRALNLNLFAPDGVTLTQSDHCTPNFCHYREEFHAGGSPHILEIEATASAPGELTFRGEAFWYDDEREDSDPFKQSFETTVIVLPPEDPVINLHATQTQGVSVGDGVSLTLTAQNPLGRPKMNLSLNLAAPLGWSIKQLDFADSCSPNVCIAKTTVDTGKARNISIVMVPNQPGTVTVEANVEWHFADDPINTKTEQRTLDLTAEPAPTPTPSPVPMPPPPSPDDPPSASDTAPEPATTEPPSAATAAPTPIPAPTAAAAPVAAPPPSNSGGGCTANLESRPLNGGGDLTLLGLSLLGLIGWTGRRRRQS